jgi:hypothetical protein
MGNLKRSYSIVRLGAEKGRNMPNLKFRKVKNGENVYITCEFCGEPISNTSAEFGMDCKNHCAEKKYREMIKRNGIRN